MRHEGWFSVGVETSSGTNIDSLVVPMACIFVRILRLIILSGIYYVQSRTALLALETYPSHG